MKNKMSFSFLALSVTCLLLPAAPGAPAEDNTSTLISGVVSNNGGADYYVGNTGTNNTLTIQSGGVLTNVANSIIGSNTTANANAATVTGSGSEWRNDGQLIVGKHGSDNTLTIADGGAVYNLYAYIGYTGTNNAAIVTGTGSVWNNSSSLSVGYFGSGNSLTITNGGRVSGTLKIGDQAGANNNTVLVTGTGSAWTSDANYVGYYGSGNTLTIANGATVSATYGVILATQFSSSNNAAIVTGSGSTWRTDRDMNIGYSGSGNTLTITNGGTVYDNWGIIGNSAPSSNNAVTVTGSGSVWVNEGLFLVGAFGSGNSLTIADGGAVNVGGDLAISAQTGASNNVVNLTGGQLTVTNGTLWVDQAGASGSGALNISGGTLLVKQLTTTDANGVINFNGGTLISQGTTVSNGLNFTIGNTGGSNATFIANGGTHSFQNDLVIGWGSAGNSLTISNGGAVVSAHGGIGFRGSNNAVTVTGAGSAWNNNSGTLYVGNNGSGNSLTITDGGAVSDHTGYIGYGTLGSPANNNSVLVTGPNSVWNSSSELYVGSYGSGNSLTVSNGGAVNVGGNLIISWIPGANNNVVNLTGGQLSVNGTLWVDLAGASGSGALNISGGTLLVKQLTTTHANGVINFNGGMIISEGTTISNHTWAAIGDTGGNAIFIANGGTHIIESNLVVGVSSSGNSLIISNGATASNGLNAYIGYNDGATSNSVTVTGPGSVWNNATNLYVGYYGSSNTLTVADGGQVINTTGYIGVSNSANANAVLVTGPGSVWTNRDELYVGYYSSGNSLTITNGGTVFNNGVNMGAVIGGGRTASNNAVLVTGPGSVWDNSSDLWIGGRNSGNSLTISDGGKVYNQAGIISADYGSYNSVFVTGSGSVWSNSDVLIIGWWDSSSNRVTIADGGRMYNSRYAWIGGWDSSNNVVVVTDPGSVWQTSTNLVIGKDSVGNTLLVTNGGAVFGVAATIGDWTNATANAAIVTGPGSVWNNSANLCVGNYGSSNSLAIINSGTVFSASVNIGNTASSSNNTATVNGGTWNNSGGFFVGVNGSGNSLTITNGGLLSSGWTGYGGIIGYGTIVAANNNSVTVTGPGSVWNNNGQEITVGNSGSGNSLIIADGGAVSSFIGYIGYEANANKNSVTVTGTGSVWASSGTIIVGNDGSGNSMTVTDGGKVYSDAGIIGYGFSYGISPFPSNNSVLVAGVDSVWSNSSCLYIGYHGSENSLTIANGGKVYNTDGYIGVSAGTNNTVTVAGLDSTWANSSDLYVGNLGISSRLIIADGGIVSCKTGHIGYDNASSNNTVLVTGTGSAWINSSDLGIGFSSSGNSLTVSNGGYVFSQNGFIGYTSSSSNNTVTVIGAGSVWTNSNILAIGNFGGFNHRLNVLDGGAVYAHELHVYNGTLRIDPKSAVQVVNYSQSTTGTLELGIGGTNSNQYGFLTVDGTASLTGTLHLVQSGSYAPSIGDTQQIVRATSVIGAFDTVTNSIPTSLKLKLIYLPDVVDLTWLSSAFLPYALTPNQRAIAANIDGAGTDPRLAALVAELSALPTNAIPGALDLIGPSDLTAMFQLAFAGMDARGYGFLGRVNELRAGSHGFSATRFSLFDFSGPGQSLQTISSQVTPCADPLLSPCADNPWGLYLEGAGEVINVHGDVNASGYHVNNGGFTIGLDRRIGDNLAIGLTLGYADTRASLGNNGHIGVDSGRASIYAAWFNQGFHLEGMLGGGYNSYDTRRLGLGGNATGKTDGTEFTGLVGGGYDWQKDIWVFGPQLTLQYQRVDIDGFSESGSLAPLHIESQSNDALQSRLGVHLGCRLNAGKVVVAPDISLSWQHEYLNDGVALDSRFANGAGNVFTVRGPGIGRDSVVIGAGVWVQWTPRIGTYLNYSTQLGRDGYEPHNASAGVNVRF